MARTLWRSQINQYKRIITFGCSWTKYFWPTWANVISEILEVPLVNQGCAGIGNVAILHKMLAWDLEHGFDDTDLVLVNWSSFTREDRIKNGCWKTGGNIVRSRFYDDKFIRNYWDEENDFVKNAGAIIMAGRLFNIDYQSYMPWQSINSYSPIQDPFELKRQDQLPNEFVPQGDWYNKWSSQISHIEGFDRDVGHEIVGFDKGWQDLACDNHPGILTHTYHAIKIAKHLGFEDTDKLDKVKEAYKQLHDNIVSDLIKIGIKKIGKDKKRTIVPQAVKLNLAELSRPIDFQGTNSNFTWHGL